MKNSIFDFRLFKEYMKQLRVIGIVATVIFCVNAVIVPLSYLVVYLTTSQTTGFGLFSGLLLSGSGSATGGSVLNMYEIHPSLAGVYLVMAPLLTLIAFSFMNRRRTCDFWHSIPQTRTCLFGSIFSAVFAWVFIAATASTILSVGISLFMMQIYTINVATIFSAYLCCLAGALLEIGAVALAMTITGNAFTNIVVSLLILGFPRALMTFIALPVTTTPLIAKGITADVLNNNLNVVTGTVFSLFDTPLKSFAPAAYTAVLGLLFAFFALLLFKKRKSEFAAQSAPNRVLQATYRILITLLFCALPMYLIFYSINSNDADPSLIYFVIVLYVVALIVYFVYEIITTRRLNNLLIALPQLGILIAANLLILGAMFAYYNFELSFSPTADTTNSVQIQESNSYWFENQVYGEDYLTAKAGEVEITDKKVIELLCEKYDSERTAVLDGGYTEDYYESSNDFVDYNSNVSLTVGFSSPIGYRYRTFWVTGEQYKVIFEELSKNEEYTSAYTELPEITDGITSMVVYLDRGYSEDEFTDSEQTEIYNALRQDVKEMGFEKWYSMLKGTEPSFAQTDYIAYINFQVSVGTENYNGNYPISLSMKHAYSQVLEALNKHSAYDKEKLLNEMVEHSGYTDEDYNDKYTPGYEDIAYISTDYYTDYYSYSVTLCDDRGVDTYHDPSKPEAMELRELLMTAIDEEPTADTRVCLIASSHSGMTYAYLVPDDAVIDYLR